LRSNSNILFRAYSCNKFIKIDFGDKITLQGYLQGETIQNQLFSHIKIIKKGFLFMSGTRYVLRRRNGFALFRCLLCTTGVNSRLLLFFSDKIDDSHFSEDNLNNNNKKEEKLHINPTAVDGENSIGW